IAYASSFDQIGIFGTVVADVALLLEVMAGPDGMDSTAMTDAPPAYSKELNADPNKKYRIAYFPEALEHQGLDPEIRQSLSALLDQLKAEGHTVEAQSFNLLEYVVPTYYILTTAEASSNLSRYDGIKYGYRSQGPHSDLTELYKTTRSEGFSWEVKRRI